VGSSVILAGQGQPTKGPDPGFTEAAIPQLVAFGFKDIDPPSAVYIQRDDILVIQALQFTGVPTSVQMTARLLLPTQGSPGQPDQKGGSPIPQGVLSPIVTLQQVFQVPSNIFPQLFSVQLQEGYLLSMTFTAVTGGFNQRGQFFIRAWLARGGGVNGVPAQLLLADYITGPSVIGWPGGRTLFPTEGPGWITTRLVGNPAAGADWIYTVPATTRERIVAFNAQLTTSAAVANRQVALIIDDAVNIFWEDSALTNITASQVAQVSGSGVNATSGANPNIVQLVQPPELYLDSGFHLRVVTTNMQAGDQWSNITIAVERWLDLQ